MSYIKQIKYNRTVSKFINVLDTVHSNHYIGNFYYYNIIYTNCKLSLFYFIRSSNTLYISKHNISYYNLRCSLSDNDIIELIHERFKTLCYNSIIIEYGTKYIEFEIIDGVIKWWKN